MSVNSTSSRRDRADFSLKWNDIEDKFSTKNEKKIMDNKE